MNDLFTTILASASVSAALAAALVWLTKDWIGERIKGAIQYEYDQKLESHRSQMKAEHDRQVERLKAELGDVSAERNARRDYEYEARKKLYAEYEPLLFQLVEHSEDAYYRILSLARTAREGDLKVEDGGWLDHPGYYARSTIYKILAPVALFKIIQRSLTFVDLSLDDKIVANYTLAKILYLTLTSDFELAAMKPPITYEPHAQMNQGRRKENPQRFWRQGIPLGCLDNVLHDCLLSEDEPSRLRTFGEFERIVKKIMDADPDHDIRLLFQVFQNFHPLTRPVLWRILVTQAHIHRLFVGRIGSRSTSPHEHILSQLRLPATDRVKFQWREDDSSDEAFDVAEVFLQEYMRAEDGMSHDCKADSNKPLGPERRDEATGTL